MSYECESCDRCFTSEHACDQHMDALNHHAPGHKCDSCVRRFDTWAGCKQHMTAVGHWVWGWECETCPTRFREERMADQHMEDKDHWSYPYECETCTYIFRTADDRDDHQQDEGHYSHLHCTDCNRYFSSEQDLKQHLNSRVHRGQNMACPFCRATFTTASGVSHHLERSACPNARNLDRQTIHRAIRQRDTQGVITERLLEWHENDRHAQWDPASAWDGHGYRCYLCEKAFNSPLALRQHITSPVHQQKLYHCPNGRCGAKKFTTLAALFNHLESESCGYVKFEAVQKNVNGFLTGGSQRLISF